jgi:hypothetical protein
VTESDTLTPPLSSAAFSELERQSALRGMRFVPSLNQPAWLPRAILATG